jgi:hypothetical protein
MLPAREAAAPLRKVTLFSLCFALHYYVILSSVIAR